MDEGHSEHSHREAVMVRQEPNTSGTSGTSGSMSSQARTVLHRLFPEIPVDAEWEILLGGLLAAAFVFSTLMGWVPHLDFARNLSAAKRPAKVASVVTPSGGATSKVASSPVARPVDTATGVAAAKTPAARVLGVTITAPAVTAPAIQADRAQVRVPSVMEIAAIDAGKDELVFDTLIPATTTS